MILLGLKNIKRIGHNGVEFLAVDSSLTHYRLDDQTKVSLALISPPSVQVLRSFFNSMLLLVLQFQS